MYSHFGQIGHQTTEEAALSRAFKNTPIGLQCGRMLSSVVLVAYLLDNYSKYFDDLLALR